MHTRVRTRTHMHTHRRVHVTCIHARTHARTHAQFTPTHTKHTHTTHTHTHTTDTHTLTHTKHTHTKHTHSHTHNTHTHTHTHNTHTNARAGRAQRAGAPQGAHDRIATGARGCPATRLGRGAAQRPLFSSCACFPRPPPPRTRAPLLKLAIPPSVHAGLLQHRVEPAHPLARRRGSHVPRRGPAVGAAAPPPSNLPS
jgi:hypothetical protein